MSSVRTAAIAGASRRALGAMSPEARRTGMHMLGFAGATVGGGITGYVVAGSWRGALTGSLVHLGMLGLAGAALGGSGRLTTTERVLYGGVGVASAVGAGYLWMAR